MSYLHLLTKKKFLVSNKKTGLCLYVTGSPYENVFLFIGTHFSSHQTTVYSLLIVQLWMRLVMIAFLEKELARRKTVVMFEFKTRVGIRILDILTTDFYWSDIQIL